MRAVLSPVEVGLSSHLTTDVNKKGNEEHLGQVVRDGSASLHILLERFLLDTVEASPSAFP